MVGGLEGKSFVLVEFEEGGGAGQVAFLAAAALGLDLAERFEGLLELAREAGAVEAEGGQLRDWGLGAGDLGEQACFEARDAVEAPSSVGEFVDELRFCGSGGLVLIAELLEVAFVGGGVFGGEDSGAGRESMAERVER